MERGRCEGEQVEFLKGALEYHFMTLCKHQSVKCVSMENAKELKDISEQNTLDEVESEKDFLSYIENLPDKQKKRGLIFRMYMIDKMKSADIARKLEVSRQYVSKTIKEMARDFMRIDC